MVFNILSIIKKNFLTLIHSKLSTIVLFLGPFALILLLWITLSGSSLNNVPLGYVPVDSSYFEGVSLSDFDQIIDFSLSKYSFSVLYYTDDYSCISDVRSGRISGCLIAHKGNLSLQTLSNNLPQNYNNSMGYFTEAYLDFSKQRIVWGIIANLNNAMADASSELQKRAFSDFSQAGASSLKTLQISIEKLEEIDRTLSTLESNLTDISVQMRYQASLLISSIYNLNYSLSALESYFNNSGLPLPPAYYSLNNSYNQLSKSTSNLSSNNFFANELSSVLGSIVLLRQEVNSLHSSLNNSLTEMSLLQEADVYKLIKPIDSTYFSASGNQIVGGKVSGQLDFLEYIFPSFFAFFSLFVSLIFSTLLVTKERVSKSATRNALSNTSSFSYVLGNFLSILLILMFQTAIILATAYLTIPSLSSSNLINLLIASIFSISIFGAIGICLGYLFNSEETAILASISVSLIFLLLSPLINPVETMSFFLRLLVQLSPIYLTESMFSRIVIFDATVGSFPWEIIVLTFFSLILLGIGIFLHWVTRYRDV